MQPFIESPWGQKCSEFSTLYVHKQLVVCFCLVQQTKILILTKAVNYTLYTRKRVAIGWFLLSISFSHSIIAVCHPLFSLLQPGMSILNDCR